MRAWSVTKRRHHQGFIMFTFFHRSPTVVLDFFTSDPIAYEFAQPTKATKDFPDWWKKLPMHRVSDVDFDRKKVNMKTCYGFLELYKRSVIIRNWSDFHYKVTPDKGYTWQKSSGPDPHEHPSFQYENGFKDYYHSKLNSPWYVREKTGKHFLFTGCTWNLENYDFLIPPGILEYSVNSSLNVNILIPKKKQTYSFFLPIGKPLVHLIPLQEKTKFDIRLHLVSSAEIVKISYQPSTLRGMKTLLELKEKQKKCPFGFG